MHKWQRCEKSTGMPNRGNFISAVRATIALAICGKLTHDDAEIAIAELIVRYISGEEIHTNPVKDFPYWFTGQREAKL